MKKIMKRIILTFMCAFILLGLPCSKVTAAGDYGLDLKYVDNKIEINPRIVYLDEKGGTMTIALTFNKSDRIDLSNVLTWGIGFDGRDYDKDSNLFFYDFYFKEDGGSPEYNIVQFDEKTPHYSLLNLKLKKESNKLLMEIPMDYLRKIFKNSVDGDNDKNVVFNLGEVGFNNDKGEILFLKNREVKFKIMQTRIKACEINPNVGWEGLFKETFWLNDEEFNKTFKQYWYEKVNGKYVKQGVYGSKGNVFYDNTERGREIFDPCSNAWYWLDSVYEGAKALDKEVFMPYIYSNEKDFKDNDNSVRNLANESNEYTEIMWTVNEFDYQSQEFKEKPIYVKAEMSDQVYDAIKNGTGKWVRYDSEGKMIKGWFTVDKDYWDIYPEQKYNTYYYDFKTGLMAKGLTTIDGKQYYFDPITGVLNNPKMYDTYLNKELFYNGNDNYWCELITGEDGSYNCHSSLIINGRGYIGPFEYNDPLIQP